MIVTVYRQDGTRILLDGYFAVKKGLKTDQWGTVQQNRFNLIVQGAADLRPGDRLMTGEGPERVDWSSFLPEQDKCFRIDYVQPFFRLGQVHHVEAGGGYD